MGPGEARQAQQWRAGEQRSHGHGTDSVHLHQRFSPGDGADYMITRSKINRGPSPKALACTSGRRRCAWFVQVVCDMAAPMPVLPDKNASLSAGGVVIRLQVIPLHVS